MPICRATWILTPKLNLNVGKSRKSNPGCHKEKAQNDENPSSTQLHEFFVNLPINLTILPVLWHYQLLNHLICCRKLLFIGHLSFQTL